MWKIECDNDTGSNDEGFWEWWSVTNDEKSFDCKKEEDAKWLCDHLNLTTASTGQSAGRKRTDYSVKFDKGKIDLTLVPTEAIVAIAKVMEFGIRKGYARDCWKTVEPERYIKALYRHWVEYLNDSNHVDEESGLPTIYHILCNAAFLAYLEGKDD